MEISYYQVDAFTSRVFGGNPAAVCPLDSWLDGAILQNIAAENNLSETAFFVRNNDCYELRWFTPTLEVDLCGHATLASAFVIFNYLDTTVSSIAFSTVSGTLHVRKSEDMLFMDFPARMPEAADIPGILPEALGMHPVEVYKSRDLLAVLASEAQVRELKPDFEKLKKIKDSFAVIVTARGDAVDFVSRFFAPNAGVPEDPVTGSAHCTLIPFWADRLGKTTLHAHQLSARGGELFCEDRGERVQISGRAVLYLQGTIYL